MSDTDEPCCRICLENTPPLLESLCDCKHTMGSVHKTCLESWLQHKRTLLNPNIHAANSMTVEEFKCDVCLAPFKFKAREFISNEDPTIIQFILRGFDMFLNVLLGHHDTIALRNAPLAEKILYPIAFFGSGISISLLCDWDYWPFYAILLAAPWTTVSLVSLLQLYNLGLDSLSWGIWRLPLAYFAWGMNMLPRYRRLSNGPVVPDVQVTADTILYFISLLALGESRLIMGLALIALPLKRIIYRRWSPERYASTRVLSVAIFGVLMLTSVIFSNLVLLWHIFTWTWQWWEPATFIAIQSFAYFFFGMTKHVATARDTVTASFDTRQVRLLAQEATLGVQLVPSAAFESPPTSDCSDSESSPCDSDSDEITAMHNPSSPAAAAAVTVAHVVPGSTAHLAGVRAGDSILAINSQLIAGPRAFLQHRHRVGDCWLVQRRDHAGHVQHVQLTLVPLA